MEEEEEEEDEVCDLWLDLVELIERGKDYVVLTDVPKVRQEDKRARGRGSG